MKQELETIRFLLGILRPSTEEDEANIAACLKIVNEQLSTLPDMECCACGYRFNFVSEYNEDQLCPKCLSPDLMAYDEVSR